MGFTCFFKWDAPILVIMFKYKACQARDVSIINAYLGSGIQFTYFFYKEDAFLRTFEVDTLIFQHGVFIFARVI